MTEIIDGQLVRNEMTEKSMGGTELMALRMVETINPELLKQFNIIHSRVRNVDPDKKNILVLHDLPNDPESAHLSDEQSRARFDKIVCVSDWQLQYYNLTHGLKYSESTVLANAITPIEHADMKPYDGTVRLIYHTTPHRGLEIVVPVFEHIVKQIPNLHLDVYSSFSIYGWEQRDQQYAELFERCKNHPNITYHGARPNEEVREALKSTHIFAYPCIWPETSCLSVIEAMSAKNIVVCPNYAALPETCAKWASMYQWSEDMNEHANRFAQELVAAIRNVEGQNPTMHSALDHQKVYYDNFYNWPQYRTKQWEALLRSILNS